MKRSSLIGHVIEVFDLFRNGRQPADNVLRQYYRIRGYLGAKDRRYVSECYFGLLRHVAHSESLALEAFRVFGFQPARGHVPAVALLLTFLLRIAREDANPLREDTAPHWRKAIRNVELDQFVSALLSVSLPQTASGNPAARIGAEQSFPEFIVSEWVREFGEAETEELCRALNASAPVTIRVNTLRCTVEDCRASLQREGIEAVPTAHSPSGLLLPGRVNINGLRTYREGWFEMQDEASQLVSFLLGVSPGSTVIDACAGGGGKTAHLGNLMKNAGRLIAIDSEERRLASIAPRLLRSGITIAEVCQSGRDDARIESLAGSADAVLIDAPCSGVGTFRRNPGAKMQVTPDSVDALSRTQAAILERYAKLLKPGGRLVYATCTLLRKENQDQVEAFLAAHPEFELRDAGEILRQQGIALDSVGQYLLLFPHKTGTDGFFGAVMERRF